MDISFFNHYIIPFWAKLAFADFKISPGMNSYLIPVDPVLGHLLSLFSSASLVTKSDNDWTDSLLKKTQWRLIILIKTSEDLSAKKMFMFGFNDLNFGYFMTKVQN